jgi:hypothetical protein
MRVVGFGGPRILAELAGIAQIDGLLVDAESLSQYGPHHGARHQRIRTGFRAAARAVSGARPSPPVGSRIAFGMPASRPSMIMPLFGLNA